MNPHVTVDRLILKQESVSLADLEHFGRVFLGDVEIEQLVLEVLVGLAAIDDSILAAVDLKQEQHVVLIDAARVIALHKLVDCVLDLL